MPRGLVPVFETLEHPDEPKHDHCFYRQATLKQHILGGWWSKIEVTQALGTCFNFAMSTLFLQDIYVRLQYFFDPQPNDLLYVFIRAPVFAHHIDPASS